MCVCVCVCVCRLLFVVCCLLFVCVFSVLLYQVLTGVIFRHFIRQLGILLGIRHFYQISIDKLYTRAVLKST